MLMTEFSDSDNVQARKHFPRLLFYDKSLDSLAYLFVAITPESILTCLTEVS